MKSGQAILNRHGKTEQTGSVNYFARAGLYVSQAILILGSLLVFFDYFGMFSQEALLWSYRIIDIWIICVGLLIVFGCVPYLYFSSLVKFKKNDMFWDVETFWIFILFMAGMFFQYGSGREYALHLVVFSTASIMVLHIYFMIISSNIHSGSLDRRRAHVYFESLKYLIAYYAITLTLLTLFNPFDSVYAMFS